MAKGKKISKKTIIISVLLLIAIIIATTMTVIFLKDRGKAEATDVDISQMQEQDRESQGQTVIESDRNDNTDPITNPDATEQDNEQAAGNNEENAEGTGTTSETNSNPATGNAGNAGTAGRDNVNDIEEVTISREEEYTVVVPEKKLSEDLKVEWEPTALAGVVMASSLDTNVPDVVVKKEAITETGGTLVSAGEKITYKISVTNNSKKDLENIDVTDIIPEYTNVDESTISNDGKVEGNKIVWNLNVKSGETVTVEFTVIVKFEVNAIDKVTIKNVAIANGEESNEVKNSVLETEKTSKIFRNGIEIKDTETEKAVVKKGDIIKYTISVKNKGEIEGTTKVIDELPENLELTKNNKYTKKELEEGILVTVAPGNTEKIEIEVKVKEINGEIKNVAIVGKEDPTDERDTVNITGTKKNITTDGLVKPGDILTYEITLTNSGNKAGTTTVTDTLDLTKVKYVSSEIVDMASGEKTEFISPDVKWENVVVTPETNRILRVTVEVLQTATGTLVNGAKIDDNTDIPETKNPIVTFNKTSVVDPNLGTENGKVIVKEGSKITYTINVKNTGDAEAKDITVTDEIPANTTLEAGSITEGGTEADRKITWNIASLAANGGEKNLRFTVTVEKQENGEISNIAYVNGTPTNEDEKQYYNPEIKATKTSTLYRDGKVVTDTAEAKAVAKVGDEIEYKITINNTGKVPGTTTVADTVSQEGVSFINEEAGVKVGDKTYSKAELEKGIEVEVPALSTKTVVFRVKVDSVNGKIKNIAIVGEEKPTDERDSYSYKVDKSLTKIERQGIEIDKNLPAKVGDILTYTIKVTNTGSVDIKNISIRDELPINVEPIGDVNFDNITVEAGKEVIKEIKVLVKSIDGKIENIVVATDKDNPKDPETDKEVTETIDLSIDKKAKLIKSAENAKHEGYEKIAEVGDTIKYTITVTNNGSIELKGVKVVDEKLGREEIVDLVPGASKTPIEVDYIVSAEDIIVEEGKTTYIYNHAVANYEDPEDEKNDVTVDDNEKVEVRDEYKYTVEYYYDGVKDATKTDKFTATFGDIINNYTDKNITGYKLEKTENYPLTVTENEAENIIKVYYVKDKFGYTVEYYYDGIIDGSKTDTFTATFGDVIDTYTGKNITGYKLDKEENLPLTISENAANNVIRIYYVKDKFGYTVEYYYDNVIDNTKTDKFTATFGDVVNTYVDKNKTGYKFEKTENLPLTITENPANNVIKVYYVKDTFAYTVEYYYDGVIDNEKTVNGAATYGDVINTYTDKIITGYKLEKVENLPLTITEKVENNVIKVYYVKDVFEYTVEYYYDNIKDNEKTDTFTATYEDVISTYIDKNKTGYKFEKTENLPLTITANKTENVIKVYYAKDTFGYTVEYYYDGVKDDTATDRFAATYGDVISIYTGKNKTGYKFEKTENLPLTITEKAENNVIKVYYVKDKFGYTVEYYYDGVIDNTKTDKFTATYGDVINNYTGKNKTGYKFEKTENLPLTITEKAENNVIKVFYVRDTFAYTVEYYYDGVKDTAATDRFTATYGDIVSIYTDKNKTGYKFEKTENLPLTITENVANNVIKVYYVKDVFGYTVEYYYDGVKDETATDTFTATYGNVITKYTDKNKTGYKFEKTENLPLTITEKAENNVIKVYYIKDTFGYTVEYYYDGVINGAKTENETATYGDVITTYKDKVITGYKLEKTENLPLTVTENPADNVIKVYYVKDAFAYTVEYYYDGVIDSAKTENETATYGDIITTYEDKVITGYKLEKTENLPLTVTEDPANNVIKVYYVKDTFAYKVEYYYDGIIDNTKTVNGEATYGDVINTYTDKNKTGYRFDKTENLPLTINENPANNVIKVYYVKDAFGYTVEYYYNGEKDATKTDSKTATYGDVITTYEDKNEIGYKFEKTENLPLTITANPANNIIKVYYVKDTFGYKVEYYYDGIIDNTKTDTFTATFEDVINTYTDKNKTGYTLDKTENLPLTISADIANNVIRVYYVKDSFAYRVEYYHDNILTDSIDFPEVEFGTEITSVDTSTYKKPGYKLDRIDTLPFTITANPANNVIKVYYIKDAYPYIINYYKDTIATENYLGRVSDTETFGTIVTADTTLYIPEGYKFEGTAPSMTIGVSNNVLNVVYVKDPSQVDTLKYTIKYYKKDGVEAEPVYVEQTVTTETPWVGLNQTTLTYQNDVNTNKYEGYTFEKIMIGTTEYTTDTIPTILPDGTVINVYYVKDITNYTVTYYVNNTQVARYPDIADGTVHTVKSDTELKITVPDGYVFTGTWHDDAGNKYLPGATKVINADLNLYADLKTEEAANEQAAKFWNKRLKLWDDANQQFISVFINDNKENQIFYCKEDQNTGKVRESITITNNGHITSILDKTTGEYVECPKGEPVTLYRGHKYEIKEDLENLTIKVVVK